MRIRQVRYHTCILEISVQAPYSRLCLILVRFGCSRIGWISTSHCLLHMHYPNQDVRAVPGTFKIGDTVSFPRTSPLSLGTMTAPGHISIVLFGNFAVYIKQRVLCCRVQDGWRKCLCGFSHLHVFTHSLISKLS
jgi:hypothetical protein